MARTQPACRLNRSAGWRVDRWDQFGISLDVDELIADEYVALGISYSVGALTVGAGVENRRLSVPTTGPDSTTYLTNYFAGAEYALAQGLFLGVGLGNLDGDQFYYNRDTRHFADTPRTFNATASIRVEF